MTDQIRVLHFYKNALPSSIGGVEKFIDTLCQETAKLGIDNKVLTLTKKPQPKAINMPGYQVIEAKQNIMIARTGFSWSALHHFRRLAKEADIIHYHFPNPFADIIHFACRPKKPVIITYHSDIIKQKKLLRLYKPLMHRFLKSADCLVATSSNYLKTSPILQQYQSKTTVIPIGLNQQSLAPLNQDRLNYWQTRLPQQFFLFIGRLRYYKGLDIAIDAIDAIGKTCHRLVIAGNGMIEKELKQKVKEKQLEKQIYFLGDISEEDKTALLTLCTAFVFPSHLRAEAFGIALLEAACFGKAMISCEIGTATSFVNQHQQTGLVIQPNSSQALADALDFLVANKEQTKQFGLNAQKRFQDYFTAEKQAKAYQKIYQKILR